MSLLPPDARASRILSMLLDSYSGGDIKSADFAAYGEVLAQISYLFQREDSMNKRLGDERAKHAQDLNDYGASVAKQYEAKLKAPPMGVRP